MIAIRAATLDDLPALTDIYNYYILNTPITFDLKPLEPHERRGWFDEHADSGRHRLLVAADDGGRLVGYASTSRWRPKAAYDTTVESSVYCRHGATGCGIGTRLYEALFAAIAGQDVHRIVAGTTVPNPASIALHERFGFTRVGEFSEVGRKFGAYWNVAWFQRAM
ncbi:MAG TPA: GNAT family N-acetyltransferase [Vicinamibacterales bacterium]|nr:GNAT family N-acetyltransferase [Vicinamibacterales bacterium]